MPHGNMMPPFSFAEVVILFIGSGIVALDTTAVGQVLFSQPLIACTFLGIFLGDFSTGLLIGVIMEMLWLKLIPIGGAMFYEGNIGSFAAAGIAIFCLRTEPDSMHIVVLYALLAGILFSYVGGKVTILHRQFTQVIVNYAIARAKAGREGSVTYGHLMSILSIFIGGGFFGVLCISLGYAIGPHVTGLIPVSYNKFAHAGIMSIWGTGIGMILSMFWQKNKGWAFFAGIILAAAGTVLLH